MSLLNLSQIQARFSLSLSHLYHPWLSLLSQGRLAVILKFLYLCRYSVLIIKEFKWQAGEAQFFDCKKNLSKSRLHLNRRLLGDITCSHRPKNNPFFWSQKTHKISWRLINFDILFESYVELIYQNFCRIWQRHLGI